MQRAEVISVDDLNWKNGFVKCACGWKKTLRNGFNGYHIANCPKCTPELETRIQRKVTTGSSPNLTVELGTFHYFALSNGIQVQYSAYVTQTIRGLSERRAESIRW